MPLSLQLRQRVVAGIERGESAVSIARRLEISERTVRRLSKRARLGLPLAPGKTGPKKPTKLTPADDAKMLELIERDPGITLNAIRAQLSATTGTVVAESTVCRRLKKLGVSLKKRA